MTAKLSDKSNILPANPNSHDHSGTNPSMKKANRSKQGGGSAHNMKKKKKHSKRFVNDNVNSNANSNASGNVEHRDASPIQKNGKESTHSSKSKENRVAASFQKNKPMRTYGEIVAAHHDELDAGACPNSNIRSTNSNPNPNNKSMPSKSKSPRGSNPWNSKDGHDPASPLVQINRESINSESHEEHRTQASPESSSSSTATSSTSKSNTNTNTNMNPMRNRKKEKNSRKNHSSHRRKGDKNANVDHDHAHDHTNSKRRESSPSSTCIPEAQTNVAWKNTHERESDHEIHSDHEHDNDQQPILPKEHVVPIGSFDALHIDIAQEEEREMDAIHTGSQDKHVTTNAAGLALLNRLSKSPSASASPSPTPSHSSCDQDHVTSASFHEDAGMDVSLEVNQSATPYSDLDVTQEEHVDGNVDGHGNGALDDPNAGMVEYFDPMYHHTYMPPPVPMWYAPNGTMNVNAANGQGVQDGVSASHQDTQSVPPQQPQQQQAWNGMASTQVYPNESQEYYNGTQEPVYITTPPYNPQEYMMPHPYPMAYYDPSFQQQHTANPAQQQYVHVSMPPPPIPLTYEQVAIGGTVFFNPVYSEETDAAGKDHVDANHHHGDEVLEEKEYLGEEKKKKPAKKNKKKGKRGKTKGKGAKKQQATGSGNKNCQE